VRHTFVSVDEWVICGEKEPERRGFFYDADVKFLPIKSLQRLAEAGMEYTRVSDAAAPTRLRDHPTVDVLDLSY
jgi:hypothetical protein